DRSSLLAAAIPLVAQLPLAALRMQLSRELAERLRQSERVHRLALPFEPPFSALPGPMGPWPKSTERR
nr:hypothetical protein [Betaproteobacteria bacterium]